MSEGAATAESLDTQKQKNKGSERQGMRRHAGYIAVDGVVDMRRRRQTDAVRQPASANRRRPSPPSPLRRRTPRMKRQHLLLPAAVAGATRTAAVLFWMPDTAAACADPPPLCGTSRCGGNSSVMLGTAFRNAVHRRRGRGRRTGQEGAGEGEKITRCCCCCCCCSECESGCQRRLPTAAHLTVRKHLTGQFTMFLSRLVTANEQADDGARFLCAARQCCPRP